MGDGEAGNGVDNGADADDVDGGGDDGGGGEKEEEGDGDHNDDTIKQQGDRVNNKGQGQDQSQGQDKGEDQDGSGSSASIIAGLALALCRELQGNNNTTNTTNTTMINNATGSNSDGVEATKAASTTAVITIEEQHGSLSTNHPPNTLTLSIYYIDILYTHTLVSRHLCCVFKMHPLLPPPPPPPLFLLPFSSVISPLLSPSPVRSVPLSVRWLPLPHPPSPVRSVVRGLPLVAVAPCPMPQGPMFV